MNLPLPLIIACFIIILALIIFPLIISYKAENLENITFLLFTNYLHFISSFLTKNILIYKL